MNTQCGHRHARALCAVGLASVLVAVAIGVSDDQIPMAKVTAFWEGFDGTCPCGDANKNGRQEIYGTSDHNHDSLVIYENQGGNSYREIKTGVRINGVRDFGYGDGDSLAEIMNYATIFRSLRPDTFPTEPVYTFNPPCQINFGEFTDLDNDGHKEVTFASNGSNPAGIYVYENRGIDQWAQVPFPRSWASGQFAVADFDKDGRNEIASGSADGDLYMFKCTGNDQYAMVCSTRLAPDIESYVCCEANNLEGDSLPRFVMLSDSNIMCHLRIFEATNDSHPQCIWRTEFPGTAWQAAIACGDLDGDGRDKIAITCGGYIRVFKCTGKHQYEQVWQFAPGGLWVRLFDLNGDGRLELITSPESTFIFEDTAGLTALQFEHLPKPEVVNLPATIVRAGSSVPFQNLDRDADVAIYDIRGRIIAKHTAIATETWRWDLTDQHNRRVPAGTYFAIIRSQQASTHLKLCIVN